MERTPPSTTSSHSGHSPDTNFRVVRKRNRVPLSCAPCRHRKLKCNRSSPCDNCIKRADTGACSYAALSVRKKNNPSQGTNNGTPDDMQNRIDRLEGLVLSLMTNGSQTPGPAAAAQVLSASSSNTGSGTLGAALDADLDESQMMDGDENEEPEDSETDTVTKSFGVMKVDTENKKTFYIGEAHWAALLSEIGEVKNYFAYHKKEFEEQMGKISSAKRDMGAGVAPGPALLFGATVPPSRAEILSQMPSRYLADILVGRYFNTFDPATHILHGPTFQKHYNQYWMDPGKTSIVWIGMLFSILRLAMLSYTPDNDEPPEFRGKCKDMAHTFRTQVAHCLISADYTKPHNHLIETLIFHLHGEYTQHRDAEASVWVLVGMIARLAMRMGYHRDSKLFPNISAYQGEMRRRIWTFVRQADLLFSFQIALPSMIRIGDSDTDLPRNIYDEEFDEDTTTLPPARPPNEATPVSYMIAKARLAFGFGRVLEEINGVKSATYEEILKIDRGLRDIYETLPEHLRLRPMSEQGLAPASLIAARFQLATIYHKSQCVLHRRFMRLAKNSNRYTHSRRTCLDSGMQLLTFQAIQHQETSDRGRMRSLPNQVSSLTTHDFLLAATVICHDLYHNRSRADFDASTPSTSASGGSGTQRSTGSDEVYVPGLSYTREQLISALETSCAIWKSQRDVSMEAYKASELLNVLLVQLRIQYGSPTQQNATFSDSASQQGNSVNDEQSAAMTLGMLQSGMTPNGQGQTPGGPQQANLFSAPGFDNNMLDTQFSGPFGTGAANTPSPFPNNMFGSAIPDLGNGMNLDWEAWDQYMQPQSLSLDPAANLWASTSPDANNAFANPASPKTNDMFGAQSNFYNLGGMMATQGSEKTQATLSSTAAQTSTDTNNGEVFMGLPTAQPSWKWTVMNDKRD